MEWMPISERIITAWLYSEYKKLTVVQAYAPTKWCDGWGKGWSPQPAAVHSFKLQKNWWLIVVMGGLNAKVGNNNTNREEVMGKFGIGVMNDNGERLCDFCSTNGFIVTGTIFPHKDIHKLTWRSPDGRTVNRIDHVLVNRNMRTSIFDTRIITRAVTITLWKQGYF